MTNFRIAAAAAACLLVGGFLVSQAGAQAPAAGGPPAPGLIVLLDVTSLIKDNAHLKAMMADMQRDVSKAEDVFRKERDQIRAMTEELKELRAGTPEYKAREEKVTKDSTDLNVKIQLQRKEFMQRESKIYYAVYQEIYQEVEYFAANNNISMVLRTTSDAVDVEKPDDILREMHKTVVWSKAGLDITQYIKQQLQRRYGEFNHTAQPGVPGRPGVPMQR